jgi:hypothetical protein
VKKRKKPRVQKIFFDQISEKKIKIRALSSPVPP